LLRFPQSFLVVNFLGGLGRREAAGFTSAGIQRGAIWSLGMESKGKLAEISKL
jgi:hypothetical protein